MSQCYMITWDNVNHIYTSEDAAVESIGMSFPDLGDKVVVESEDTYNAKTYDVATGGLIQYRVTITKCEMNDRPTNFTSVRRSTAEF